MPIIKIGDEKMKSYCNLYVSDDLIPEKEDILKKIHEGTERRHYSVALLPVEGKVQLELIEAKFLRQSYYHKQEMLIVGILSGYEDALKFVEELTQTVYEETGTANVRAYILAKQKEFEER